jgi:hypothetical protein
LVSGEEIYLGGVGVDVAGEFFDGLWGRELIGEKRSGQRTDIGVWLVHLLLWPYDRWVGQFLAERFFPAVVDRCFSGERGASVEIDCLGVGLRAGAAEQNDGGEDGDGQGPLHDEWAIPPTALAVGYLVGVSSMVEVAGFCTCIFENCSG